jgi:uncharacterized protein with ATP-grasp and redox domains
LATSTLPLTPQLPIPEPLRGRDPGSFAQHTVSKRLPELGRLALAENDFPPTRAARLEALVDEMPAGLIRQLDDPSAPDLPDWQTYTTPYAGQDWLEVPWLFAEHYFYRRLLEASGYFQPGPTAGSDPYRLQKRRGLELSVGPVQALAASLAAFLEKAASAQVAQADDLADLLLLNIWGNQADLSMWPAGQKAQPSHADIDRQRAHLLVDDSARVADFLLARAVHPGPVVFALDNTGLELLSDLALADYLLATSLAAQVVFHTKFHPTFVSDALASDVRATVAFLAQAEELAQAPEVRAWARRLQAHLESGRLRLVSAERYWNSPLAGWELPAGLRHDLSRVTLLISKGDANYRRWLGDRHWARSTPAAAVLRYLPAPWVALRVFKAEIAIGLPPDRVEQLDQTQPGWMTNGTWGLIQFIS